MVGKLALSLAFAAILSAAAPSARADYHNPDYYRSVDGSLVHRPTTAPGNFGTVTAICRDGTKSFSHHVQGTCSRHGGVAVWK